MDNLAALLTSFDTSILFAVAERIANILSATITPVLLLISIYIRLMETQIDAIAGNGKYGTALRDMLLWTFVLGAYYGITNLVFGFFNPVYAWFESFGSIATTMATFTKVMAQNKAALEATDIGMTDIMATPYALIAMLLYYVTLVIIAFLSAFLKVANVMILCVAFVWGFIAIPVSISTTFKILRGWGLLVAFALVWPIVQGLMMAMFAMLFANSANVLLDMTEMNATVRGANIMMLFAVMHLLLAAVMVSAPFIANALVSNSSAAGGIVMPFVAAATAAGAATIKGGQAQGTIPSGLGGGSSTPKVAGSNSNYRIPTARAASDLFAKNNSITNSANTQQTTTKISSQSSAPQSTSTAKPNAHGPQKAAAANTQSTTKTGLQSNTPQPATTSKTNTPPSAQRMAAAGSTGLSPDVEQKNKKQQRRGVVVRQQMKRTKA